MSERRHKSDAEYLDEANEAVRELVTAQANRICRNCRWWLETDDDENEWREESDPSDIRIARGCCDLTHYKSGKAAHDTSKATAGDGSGFFAVLWTKPDFGCVQWEGKG